MKRRGGGVRLKILLNKNNMYTLLRIYIGLATLAAAALVAAKCKRARLDEEEDGAGDGHEGQPRDRPLVPVHDCGRTCDLCPHRSSEVGTLHAHAYTVPLHAVHLYRTQLVMFGSLRIILNAIHFSFK